MTDPQPPDSPPPWEPDTGQSVPSQPPTTHPYAPRPPRPSSWPTVVGVISIAWGSLGTLGGCCSVGMAFFWKPYIEFISSMVPPAQRQQQMGMLEQIDPANPLMLGVAAVGLGLAILLIVAGVQVLKRRQKGPHLSKVYAFADIPLVIASSLLTFTMQSSMQSATPFAMPGGFGTTFAAVMAAIGFLFNCAWPAFLLVWFSRASIKDEIAGWP